MSGFQDGEAKALAESIRDVGTAALRALVDQGPGWSEYTMALAVEIAAACERFGVEPAAVVRDGVHLFKATGARRFR